MQLNFHNFSALALLPRKIHVQNARLPCCLEELPDILCGIVGDILHTFMALSPLNAPSPFDSTHEAIRSTTPHMRNHHHIGALDLAQPSFRS